MSSLGKVRFHICGGEIKPWPEAACQCVGANDFDPVARIAELESICENNADALAFYDARGKRIAELEEQQDRQIVAVAEAVDEARKEGYETALADVLALPQEIGARAVYIRVSDIEALRNP